MSATVSPISVPSLAVTDCVVKFVNVPLPLLTNYLLEPKSPIQIRS